MPFVDLASNQQNSNQNTNMDQNTNTVDNTQLAGNPSQPVKPPTLVSDKNLQSAGLTQDTKKDEVLYPPLEQTLMAQTENDVKPQEEVKQVDLGAGDTNVTSANSLPEIKDPVSKDDGLLEQAFVDPMETNDHKEVVEDDGTRMVSKPFVQSPTSLNTSSSTPVIGGNPVKQTISSPTEPNITLNTNIGTNPVEPVENLNTIVEKQRPVEPEQSLEVPVVEKENPDVYTNEVVNTIETAAVDSNVLKPSIAQLQNYVDLAVSKGASDIHFSVDYPVYLRVDGRLEKIGQDALTDKHAERLLLPILTAEQKKSLVEDNIECDFMHVDPEGNRFRVNIYKERGHLAGAFRQIPKRVRTVDELGLPAILKDFSRIPYGLVLVTGPTGSGKSTSIAAMIEEINRTEPRHVVSIEDPVEYIYEPKVALIAQRNMHDDTSTWKAALRSVLRQDPDVVVIGEMRDYETIASALTIAETGHLVFATLHTNNAAQSVDRIIDVFPEGQQNQVRSQLSNMLSGIISQRLVPLKGGGRKAALEILIGTPAVKNAIREGKTHQINNIIQTSSDVGMVSIEKSLVDLIRSGDIDIETAKHFTIKPDEIDLLLR